MELQPICEFWDFLYHLVDVSIVFVGVAPGTLEHHLRLVLELLLWWNLLTDYEVI